MQLRDSYSFFKTSRGSYAPLETDEGGAESSRAQSGWFSSVVSSISSKLNRRGEGAEDDVESQQPQQPSEEPGPEDATAVPDPCFDALNLSWKQRVAMFVLLAGAGCVFLGLSFFYVTLVVVGQSAKFAMCYTFGNILLLSSSCVLVGPAKQLKGLFSQGRLVATFLYLASMLGTMYSAWRIRSAFVVIPMIVVQFICLMWYLASYFGPAQRAMAKAASFMCRRMWPLR